MSQPPQPPNQPPAGGFGAPQEPSQGGFGASQQPQFPPPAPPAGPPTPPAPPASPPAWGGAPGYPQHPTQPNPYAQQPQYGYPQAGAYGTPGPGGAPGVPGPGGQGDQRRKKRTALIVGVAVAVVLAAGGAVWAVVGGDDGDKKPTAQRSTEPEKSKKNESSEPTGGSEEESPTPGEEELDPNEIRQDGEAKVLFQTPAPKVARSGVDVPGFWVLDGYVVKAVQEKVIAYDDSGEEKWNVPLPKAVCAAPTTASDDGKVVVAYGGRKKDECSQLALIDLKAGKKLWDKPAPEGGLFGEGHTSMGMAQSGNAVGLSWFGGSAMVNARDGSEMSPPELTASCSVNGWAGGKALLRAYSCNDGTGKLQKLDPNTGKVKWAYPVRRGYEVTKIYSSSPVVIQITDEKRKSAGLIALDESGKERSVLDPGKQSYQPDCGMDFFGTNMGSCQGVVTSDDTFYLPTALGRSSSSGLTTEIHAFDLNTGKKKGVSKVNGRMMLPLRMDGKNLLAYQQPTYDKAGAIVSIPPNGGAPTKTVLQLPAATREAESGFYRTRRVFDEQGHFYMASERLTGDKDKEKLILAFGP